MEGAPPPATYPALFIAPGPLYEPLHTESFPWFTKAFLESGFTKGDIVANTFSYHLSPGGLLFHEAIRQCGATAVPVGVGNTEILIRTMLDIKVTGFVGTPSYLMSVIKKAEEMGKEFSPGQTSEYYFHVYNTNNNKHGKDEH
ncbi:MAG: phenylacetate--CoA ligase [Bacteroidales bacterium]|nr:phenylacetate--CoA ligase [Bacteroidales bacterium]